ncbi:hypothetical protein [Streptomyces sp. NBC_00467]|uniref:hypothetical protein n=1 Tax=Streptomyces sp. NBC_00467 TaxID=2975752 RepID=UPI002E1922F9
MPDLVQAVGRALRMQPGEGNMASLVVPVLLGPGRSAGSPSCWRRCGRTTARIVERLAEQQAPSRYKPVAKDESGKSTGAGAARAPEVSAPPPRPC